MLLQRNPVFPSCRGFLRHEMTLHSHCTIYTTYTPYTPWLFTWDSFERSSLANLWDHCESKTGSSNRDVVTLHDATSDREASAFHSMHDADDASLRPRRSSRLVPTAPLVPVHESDPRSATYPAPFITKQGRGTLWHCSTSQLQQVKACWSPICVEDLISSLLQPKN